MEINGWGVWVGNDFVLEDKLFGDHHVKHGVSWTIRSTHAGSTPFLPSIRNLNKQCDVKKNHWRIECLNHWFIFVPKILCMHRAKVSIKMPSFTAGRFCLNHICCISKMWQIWTKTLLVHLGGKFGQSGHDAANATHILSGIYPYLHVHNKVIVFQMANFKVHNLRD